MCRIAGIVDASITAEVREERVRKMCFLQKHGGPDDEGFFASPENNLVLGHRRLSLIDLSSAGHQPMQYLDGRYQIIYNGELYNYLELKAELKQMGYQFNNNTDTEVILAAFAKWGSASFAKFNGMFAFAIWSKDQHEIYLVRDSSGIKPLYYSNTPGSLSFASEVKAFDVFEVNASKNDNWKVYLMAYGHLPEPITTKTHVHPLPKGCFLKYSLQSGQSRVESFAHYSYVEQINRRDEAIDLVRTSLKAAVDRHLIADAPLGVFLSGGIDSSIVALLANKSTTALNTLSIYFDEKKYSEKKYQDVLKKSLNCNHHDHLLKESDFHQYFPDILKAMDQPSSDGVNTWFISKYAREAGLKAVLSGIGGDELFGGYPSFKRMGKVKSLEKLPDFLLKSGDRTKSKILRRAAFLTLGGARGKYLFLRGFYIPSEIACLLDMDESEVWDLLSDQPVVNDIHYLSSGNQASYVELNLYMQNQLLKDADSMSMAHGLEIRVPFLDRDFLKMVLMIKSNIKYAGSLPKQLLIDAFKPVLPEAIWNRPKMGFAFPFKQWMGNNEYVKDSLQNKGEHGRVIYSQFKEGQVHWSQVMMLLLAS